MTPDILTDSKPEMVHDLFAPTVHFPSADKRRVVEVVDGYKAYEYIPEEQMRIYLKNLFDRIPRFEDSIFLVNVNGGRFMIERYKQYLAEKGEALEDSRIFEIEYHRAGDEGKLEDNPHYGVEVVKSVPEEVRGRNVVVLEDVGDRFFTLRAIQHDAENLGALNSTLAVAAIKLEVENQAYIKGVLAAAKIDNVWVGGCGMNIGNGENPPKALDDKIRMQPAIFAMIQD